MMWLPTWLTFVSAHRVRDDTVKARGRAHVGNQPVDLIIKPAGQRLAFLAVKRERLGKVFLRALFKKPGFHRPMS